MTQGRSTSATARYSRERRAKNKARGICIHCGSRPVVADRSTCAYCQGQNAARYHNLIKRGMCPHHKDQKAEPGYTQCQFCLDRLKVHHRKSKRSRPT